jgi:hypothetical protein
MIITAKQVMKYDDGTEIITGFIIEETINEETCRYVGETKQRAIEMWFESMMERQELDKNKQEKK